METGFAGTAGNNNDSVASFECNICFELAQEPIVTLCGHLFCWPCLYKWLHVHSRSLDCPVCKAIIEEDKLVPLYGRGKTSTSHDPQSRSIPGRPTGQRPGTAPPPDPNRFAHPNPPRPGNYAFSPFPYLNFHVHGFPDAYGSFHGGHGHAFHHHYHHHHHPSHGHQHADVYLKAMLFLVAALVAATLVLS